MRCLYCYFELRLKNYSILSYPRGTVKAVIQTRSAIKGYKKAAYLEDIIFLYHSC